MTVTTRSGAVLEIDAKPGRSLMENIREHASELQAICGGCCSCATCHVIIDPACMDLVGPPSEDEAFLIEGSNHYEKTSRLSCQIPVTAKLEGLKLTIAAED